MLLVHNQMDHTAKLSAEEMQKFLQDVMSYINDLMKKGILKAAQPLVKEGKIISGSKGNFKDGPFNESKEVIVGYYHVVAADIDEAIAIAKGNPEFAYTETARIEVRQLVAVERKTGFMYPGK